MKTWKEESEYIQELFNAEAGGVYTLEMSGEGATWSGICSYVVRESGLGCSANVVYGDPSYIEGDTLRELQISMGDIDMENPLYPELDTTLTFNVDSNKQVRASVKAAVRVIGYMDTLYDELLLKYVKEGIEV